MVLKTFDNHHQNVVFSDIQDTTGIETEALKRVLHSLSCAKFKILCKDGSGNQKSVSITDSFKVNADFKNPLKKVVE